MKSRLRLGPALSTSASWSTRLYEVTDVVLWTMRLNLLWMVFTAAGGVVLGVGPATVAAYTLARRHAHGESFHAWPAFWTEYRREFGRGSVLVLPLLAVAGVNYLSFESGTVPRVATSGAVIAVIVIAAYALPMAVHYDLPVGAYVPKALLFALTRPAATILLLFVLAAVVFATVTFPLLAMVISVGGWIQLDTWLCLRFFAENEARLHAKGNS